MKICIILITLLFSFNILAKDRVECKAMTGASINTPDYVKKITDALNKEVKNPEKIKDISTSNHNGDVVVCIVVEGE